MTAVRIPFNRPHLFGTEGAYVAQALAAGRLSGNGLHTQYCQSWLAARYGFGQVLLTQSGTAALELCALLAELQPGDEVILPSFTFVSTASAFALRGARLVFADSQPDHPNLDLDQLAGLITPRTRVLVVVHYAGMAAQMEAVLALARAHNLLVVEDAAHALHAQYQNRWLGTWGDMAAFSFHETKNVSTGEGGMLVVNNPRLAAKAEILWEKGTNRAALLRGETAKYEWQALGSSFLPSEIMASYLRAQLDHLDLIQARRHQLWQTYWDALAPGEARGAFQRPRLPAQAQHNAHLFYLVCPSQAHREVLLQTLRERGILAVFHYQSLHRSPYYHARHDGRLLPQSDRYSACLVRLPLYFDLTVAEVEEITGYVLAASEAMGR